MTDFSARRVSVEGRVQGVWFRGWVVEQARARGLTGWVRNRCDGTVEALFCGPSSVVEDMVALCWSGPPAAVVGAVTDHPADVVQEPGFFQIPSL